MIKKIVLALSLVGLTLGHVNAQEKVGKTPEQRATHQSQKMKSNLGLNEDQAGKVYTILLNRIKAVDLAKTQHPEKTKERHQAVKQINETAEAELKAVLTPEQFAQYQKNKEEHKEERKEKRKAQGAGASSGAQSANPNPTSGK